MRVDDDTVGRSDTGKLVTVPCAEKGSAAMRRAVQTAIGHGEMLAAGFGDTRFFIAEGNHFPKGTPFYSDVGTAAYNERDARKAKAMAEEALAPMIADRRIQNLTVVVNRPTPTYLEIICSWPRTGATGQTVIKKLLTLG